MKINVVGMGYVGLANALLLSTKNDVVGTEINMVKLSKLQAGESPLNDVEIGEYLKTTTAVFSDQLVLDSELFIIATPTDYDENTNSFNTQSIETVIEQIPSGAAKNSTILIKSTIPVGYVNELRRRYENDNIIFSPEFLREGHALYDNLYPTRIVIGEKSQRAKRIAKLFADCALNDPPIIYTNPTEAEAIKLFANTYLALRVAYFNELDTYCRAKELVTKDVIDGICLDPRIGSHYNNPSFGYGGYCLPKDTKQLLNNYQGVPQDIISAVVAANKTRKRFIVDSVLAKEPTMVGIYRLTMKSGSDNFRQSAVLDIAKSIKASNVEVVIYEPTVNEYQDYKINNNLQSFINECDIILANRLDDKVKDCKNKVYTCDLFGEN